jgi:hypothetical protein
MLTIGTWLPAARSSRMVSEPVREAYGGDVAGEH